MDFPFNFYNKNTRTQPIDIYIPLHRTIAFDRSRLVCFSFFSNSLHMIIFKSSSLFCIYSYYCLYQSSDKFRVKLINNDKTQRQIDHKNSFIFTVVVLRLLFNFNYVYRKAAVEREVVARHLLLHRRHQRAMTKKRKSLKRMAMISCNLPNNLEHPSTPYLFRSTFRYIISYKI